MMLNICNDFRSPTAEFIKPYSGPALTPSKVREHMVWQKTVDPFVLEHMPPALVRRQEAIYELLQVGQARWFRGFFVILLILCFIIKSINLRRPMPITRVCFCLPY